MNRRIYTDGVFDLFHRGHIECFKYIKNKYPLSQLVVGLISDIDAQSYKRLPIINEEDRLEVIKSVKYIDEVIFPSPLVLTPRFLEENSIDLVMHGFSNEEDAKKQNVFFKNVLNNFQVMPYYTKSSTTKIINNIKNNY